MKTLLSSVIAFTFFLSTFAHADDGREAIRWQCKIKSEVAGFALGLGFGIQLITGKGMIKCRSSESDQATKVIPVRVDLGSAGAALEISYIKSLKIEGTVWTDNPRVLLNTFNLGGAIGGTLVDRGAEGTVTVPVSTDNGDLGFQLSFIGKQAYGIGAHLHGMVLSIRADEEE